MLLPEAHDIEIEVHKDGSKGYVKLDGRVLRVNGVEVKAFSVGLTEVTLHLYPSQVKAFLTQFEGKVKIIEHSKHELTPREILARLDMS